MLILATKGIRYQRSFADATRQFLLSFPPLGQGTGIACLTRLSPIMPLTPSVGQAFSSYRTACRLRRVYIPKIITPYRTRTCNIQLRKLMLYPVELRMLRIACLKVLTPSLSEERDDEFFGVYGPRGTAYRLRRV